MEKQNSSDCNKCNKEGLKNFSLKQKQTKSAGGDRWDY